MSQLNSELCRLGVLRSENQSNRKERQVLRPCQRNKRAINHESDGDTNCNCFAWNDSQGTGKGTGRVRK